MREPDNPTAEDFRRRAHQMARQKYPGTDAYSQMTRVSFEVGWLSGECADLAADNRRLRARVSDLEFVQLEDGQIEAIARASADADAPEGLEAAEAAYLALLRYIPIGSKPRLEIQTELCALRNYIAKATGRDAESVQNEYEAHAVMAEAEGKALT